MTSSARKSRRKKPVPAALAVTSHVVLEEGVIKTIERPLIEQLAPTDPLRICLVASDPDVREALELASFTRAQVVHLLKLTAPTPEWAAAHAGALQAHASAVRDVLTPAILEAEEQRRLIVALTPADHAALARAVVRRVDGDRVLAVYNLLCRNPSWKDPALWTAPDTVRYLAKAVSSEARFLALQAEG